MYHLFFFVMTPKPPRFFKIPEVFMLDCHAVNQFGKAGYLAGGGSFVKNAFFYSLINNRLGGNKRFSGVYISRLPGCRSLNFLDHAFNSCSHCLIALTSFQTLTRSLQCGFMICQSCKLLSPINFKSDLNIILS